MKGSSKKFCPTNAHFIKPLLPGFHSNLAIPESFNKYYLSEKVKDEVDGKIATLRNSRVNKIWWVEMDFDEKNMYFGNGWRKFCEDHGLEVGDIVAFKHEDNLVFEVLIFDPTTCERPFPGFHHPPQPPKKVKSCSSSNYSANKGFSKKVKGLKGPKKYKKISSSAKVNFVPRDHPYCHTVVKAYCLQWGGMILPFQFARENNLTDKWCDMTLIDQEGKEWPVHLRHCKKKSRSVYIGKWREFHKRSGLKTGDPIVFELIRSGENPIMNVYK